MSRQKKKLENYQELVTIEQDILAFQDLFKSDETLEKDGDMVSEFHQLITTFNQRVTDMELTSLLSGKHDDHDAIVSLFSGAGGTDAQDWTAMLLRMYTRWFETKDFSYEVIEQTVGDEAGIKSVTMLVKGDLVYGLLKHEHGVHRLVRQSPFNANSKRQTSFAALEVVPQIDTAVSDVKIDPKDLKIDTYRASGAGGQHVNKTDSAVRITHLPTGLVSTSQASRSQISNKETALKILMSRFVVLLEKEKKQEVSELRGEQKENAWGNQIRSYVLHPYKLVKDLRSQYETSHVSGVLDGDLDAFIKASLHQKKNGDAV